MKIETVIENSRKANDVNKVSSLYNCQIDIYFEMRRQLIVFLTRKFNYVIIILLLPVYIRF